MVALARHVSEHAGHSPSSSRHPCVARALASGDLSNFVANFTGRARRGAQSAAAHLSQLGLSMRTVMRDVRMDLDRLQGATREIAASSRDLSARTEAQAASLEETAAGQDQISGMAQQTADLATPRRTAGRIRQQYRKRSAKKQSMRWPRPDRTSRNRLGRIGDLIQSIEGVAPDADSGISTRPWKPPASVSRAWLRRGGQRSTRWRCARQICPKKSKPCIGIKTASQEEARMSARHGRAWMTPWIRAQGRAAGAAGYRSRGARTGAQGVVQIGQAIQQMDGITQQNAALVGQLAAAAGRMDAQTEEALQHQCVPPVAARHHARRNRCGAVAQKRSAFGQHARLGSHRRIKKTEKAPPMPTPAGRKRKVVNHHHDVPFRLLDKQYSFVANEGTPANSTGNRIIHGDNLQRPRACCLSSRGG